MALRSSSRRLHISTLFVLLTLFLNAGAFVWVILSFTSPSWNGPRSEVGGQTTYTYISSDYPTDFLVDLPDVLLATDEFVHYQLYGQQAMDDWIMQVPRNNGAIRLGDQHRAFVVTVGH